MIPGQELPRHHPHQTSDLPNQEGIVSVKVVVA